MRFVIVFNIGVLLAAASTAIQLVQKEESAPIQCGLNAFSDSFQQGRFVWFDNETELSQLAAGMKPKTWVELKTKGYTTDLLKAQTHNILEYAGAAAWSPTTQEVFFVGQGHYSALKFIDYSAQENSWHLRATPPWWKGDVKTGKGPIGHAYYNNTIDPIQGILFFHESNSRRIHRYNIARDEWTTLPEIKDAATGHGTAIAYFPDQKTLVRVLGGTVHLFNEAKNTWTKHPEKLDMGPYHNIAQYSAAQKLVLLGGGNNSKNLYKLDAQRSISQLPPAPFEVGINTTLVTSDPASGDFLILHKDDHFYSLNASTGTWKELRTEGMPFSMKRSSFDVVATPLANIGVTLFFTGTSKGIKVCLYKHGS